MKKEITREALPVSYESAQNTALCPVSVSRTEVSVPGNTSDSNSIEMKYKDISVKSQGFEACLITAGTVIAATVIIAAAFR